MWYFHTKFWETHVLHKTRILTTPCIYDHYNVIDPVAIRFMRCLPGWLAWWLACCPGWLAGLGWAGLAGLTGLGWHGLGLAGWACNVFFGYVLQARSLNLQFLKTAFVLNETQPSEMLFNRFRFFHGFDIYHWITKWSVGCWGAQASYPTTFRLVLR